jgi:saccharopine dehydrogenase-like NADP-dependent oxidoreductase
MRSIVLGGAGDVGHVVTKDLAAAAGSDDVCIGDIDLEKARSLAAELGSNVTARSVDINDAAGLIATLKDYDVAVNCVGPFYKHGSKVLEACIQARVPYVDICDDYDAPSCCWASTANAERQDHCHHMPGQAGTKA